MSRSKCRKFALASFLCLWQLNDPMRSVENFLISRLRFDDFSLLLCPLLPLQILLVARCLGSCLVLFVVVKTGFPGPLQFSLRAHRNCVILEIIYSENLRRPGEIVEDERFLYEIYGSKFNWRSILDGLATKCFSVKLSSGIYFSAIAA